METKENSDVAETPADVVGESRLKSTARSGPREGSVSFKKTAGCFAPALYEKEPQPLQDAKTLKLPLSNLAAPNTHTHTHTPGWGESVLSFPRETKIRVKSCY